MHESLNELAPDATLPRAESLFWLSIGVLFLCGSSYLAFHFSHYELAGLALAGIFFGAQPRWTQLFFYMAIAVALFALGKCLFGYAPFFWTFGLLLSILSSWFILSFAADWALAVEESQEEAAPPQEEGLQQALDEKSAACEKLQKECVAIRQTVALIAQEKDVLQKRLEELQKDHARLQLHMSAESLEISFIRSEKEALQKELDRARSEEGLKQQNEQLFKELNAARSAQEQTKLINETLARLYAAEKQANEELRQQPVAAVDDPDVAQLRRQFEDRRIVLHQTRSELFHTDTERQMLLRERDEPLYDAGENRLFSAVEEELKCLEEENRLLEEIIATASKPANKVGAWLELHSRPSGGQS